MMLLELLGRRVVAPAEEGLAAELRGAALAFARAGGSVTLSEWRSLTEEERAALTAAGEIVRAEAGLAVALASADPVAALRVGWEDGGSALRRAAVAAAQGTSP